MHLAQRGVHRIHLPKKRASTLSFFSKHAHALARFGRDREFFAWLTDYFVDARRWPNRASNPMRLVGECQRWHEHEHWSTELDPETPLHCGAYRGPDTCTDGHNRVERLLTVGDLAGESAAMQHCIATYAESAVNGTFVAFRGELCGERVTIGVHVDPKTSRYSFMEAKRFANASLTAAQSGVLSRWLAEIWGRERDSVLSPLGLGPA
jgi:hypothetical protein